MRINSFWRAVVVAASTVGVLAGAVTFAGPASGVATSGSEAFGRVIVTSGVSGTRTVRRQHRCR